jgi:hypothetical protein
MGNLKMDIAGAIQSVAPGLPVIMAGSCALDFRLLSATHTDLDVFAQADQALGHFQHAVQVADRLRARGCIISGPHERRWWTKMSVTTPMSTTPGDRVDLVFMPRWLWEWNRDAYARATRSADFDLSPGSPLRARKVDDPVAFYQALGIPSFEVLSIRGCGRTPGQLI